MSSAGRPIAARLAVLAAALVMLGCGSGEDVTGADIDPQTASELTAQLDKIQSFLDEGNCDRAIGAVDTLRGAINADSGSTGQKFTENALKLVDELEPQVEEQCVDALPETTSTTDSSDTEPTTTESTTVPTTTSTETTTTKSTTTTTSTDTTTEPSPQGNPGGGNNGGTPGGGVVPGGGKKENSGRIKKPEPKKGHSAKDERKERGR